MDSQPNKPPVIIQPSNPSSNPVKPPPKQISDQEAQSLLAVNSLEVKQATKASKKFLFLVLGSIVVIVALTLFIESRNHGSSTGSGSLTGSSKNPFTSGSNTGSSVNSEVKYCSNPVNAQLTC